jgi:hypothetical protein
MVLTDGTKELVMAGDRHMDNKGEEDLNIAYSL